MKGLQARRLGNCIAVRQRRKEVASSLPAPVAGEELASKVVNARKKAVQLFDRIEKEGIVTAGRSEREIDRDIFKLAAAECGTRKHWHARTPRIGQNTLNPIFVRAPVRVMTEDDICYVDLGPVFEEVEADFGRTYVTGQDPAKHALNEALEAVFNVCRDHYLAAPQQTGAEFFEFVMRTCCEHGYEYAHDKYCARLLGEFPHERSYGDAPDAYACKSNDQPMNAPSADGKPRHWILEIHLLQKPELGSYGGFYEDLLDIRY